MGYRCTFMDNQTNTVEDLNSISVNLLSTDNVAFSEEDIIGADDLNNISKNLITKGISRSIGNECSVSVNDETITANSGTAFFGNGMCIIIDEYGISTPKNDIETGYIYLYYDYNLNEIRLEHSSSLPDDEAYYVALYKLTNNELTDIRQYANMKNPSVLPNQYGVVETSFVEPDSVYFDVTVSLGGAYKKFMLYTKDYGIYVARGFFDIENEYCWGYDMMYEESNHVIPFSKLGSSWIVIYGTQGSSSAVLLMGISYDESTNSVTFRIKDGDHVGQSFNLKLEVM